MAFIVALLLAVTSPMIATTAVVPSPFLIRVPNGGLTFLGTALLVAASEFATVALVQIYCYRRVAGPRERQQNHMPLLCHGERVCLVKLLVGLNVWISR